jgi:hypothetical protein
MNARGAELLSQARPLPFRQKKIWKSAFSWAFQIFEMVGRVGFEPTTRWLKTSVRKNLPNRVT